MRERSDLDLAGALSELRRRAWLVAAVIITAAGMGFGLSQLQDPRYVATADLLFRPDPNPNAAERTAATNLALANLDAVVVRVRRKLGMRNVRVNELRDRVVFQPMGQADLLQIEASARTPAEAARLANAFADEVVAVRRESAEAALQRQIDAIDARLAATDADTELAADLAQRRKSLLIDMTLAEGNVEIAEPASLPLERAAPKPLRNAAIAAILGLVLAVMLLVLMRTVDQRMSEEEVQELFGAPILARVPITGSTPWRQQLHREAFQFLRANIVALEDDIDTIDSYALREDALARMLVITSPSPADGKSTVVAQLSAALAEGGAMVLAIDSDLRKPTLGAKFAIPEGKPGLIDLLGSDRLPNEPVQPTSVPRLSVLPGGSRTDNLGAPIVSPRRLLHVVDLLRYRADIVLIDTAPVTIAAETSVLAARASGVIVVLDVRNLNRDTLTASRDQLQRVDARVLGVVLNYAEPVNERVLREAYGRPPRKDSPSPESSSARTAATALGGGPQPPATDPTSIPPS